MPPQVTPPDVLPDHLFARSSGCRVIEVINTHHLDDITLTHRMLATHLDACRPPDMRAAISASLPAAACWYRIAAPGVE